MIVHPTLKKLIREPYSFEPDNSDVSEFEDLMLEAEARAEAEAEDKARDEWERRKEAEREAECEYYNFNRSNE